MIKLLSSKILVFKTPVTVIIKVVIFGAVAVVVFVAGAGVVVIVACC